MKIVAAVDIMGGSVVRLVRGNPDDKVEYSNDPVETARKWESVGADMLHIVDLDAAFSTGSNSELIAKISQAVRIPLQIAGGTLVLGAIVANVVLEQRRPKHAPLVPIAD